MSLCSKHRCRSHHNLHMAAASRTADTMRRRHRTTLVILSHLLPHSKIHVTATEVERLLKPTIPHILLPAQIPLSSWFHHQASKGHRNKHRNPHPPQIRMPRLQVECLWEVVRKAGLPKSYLPLTTTLPSTTATHSLVLAKHKALPPHHKATTILLSNSNHHSNNKDLQAIPLNNNNPPLPKANKSPTTKSPPRRPTNNPRLQIRTHSNLRHNNNNNSNSKAMDTHRNNLAMRRLRRLVRRVARPQHRGTCRIDRRVGRRRVRRRWVGMRGFIGRIEVG